MIFENRAANGKYAQFIQSLNGISILLPKTIIDPIFLILEDCKLSNKILLLEENIEKSAKLS